MKQCTASHHAFGRCPKFSGHRFQHYGIVPSWWYLEDIGKYIYWEEDQYGSRSAAAIW